jgi:transcriptional regulator with XRE-family HTH domain
LGTLCKLYGLTQVELSKRLGMQPSHLNIFLRGRSDIHSQRLLELLNELGISVEDQIDAALARLNGQAPKDPEQDLALYLRRMTRAERESLGMIITRLGRERGRNKRT